MAVLQVAPHEVEFERVVALTGIAKAVLSIRIVCCLLVTGWVLAVELNGLAILLCLASSWFVTVLLRWETFGISLSTHPLILGLDVALCLVVLFRYDPLSPLLLLLGSGAVLAGVCLGTRGAMVFAPGIAVGWWLAAMPLSASGRDEQYLLGVVVPVVLAGTLFLGSGIRASVLEADRLVREQQRQTRLAGVAEERARLAREMHDSLVKSLQGVAMLAETLPAWMERDPERAASQAGDVSRMLRQATVESRDLVVAMRRADATADLATQVGTAVERWRGTTSRRAECRLDSTAELSTESGYELLAILDEALENVHRHTPPETSVEVVLEVDGAWVDLLVRDDGPGSTVDLASAAPRQGHFGVLGMRERAARAGGVVRMESQPEQGTAVRVRLPAALDEEEFEW